MLHVGQRGANHASRTRGGVIIPTPPSSFTDDFNRADENLDASPNWTLQSGTATQMGVRTNQLAAIGSVESVWLCPNQGSANHYTEATWVATGGNGPFMACRLQDINNFVGVRSSATLYQIWTRIAGTLTQLSTTSPVPAVNDLVRIEANGDTVGLLINGIHITGSPFSLGGALSGITRQGVISRTAARNPWLDNYKSGAL